MARSPWRALLAGVLGSVVALGLWLAVAVPAALRLLHIDPVPAPGPLSPPAPRHDATLPTAVVLASQAGTEVTDFLAPYAILAASGAFDVYAVAPGAGPAPTNGGLGIVPHATLEGFDAAHPGGADLVVVPNVLDPDNPALLEWVTRQGRRGALVASICEGARLLARTGLLDGRVATTHFTAVSELATAFPRIRWRDDVRFVADDAVLTSAGVSAAIDAALYLVDRFAGPAAAARTARALDLPLRENAAPPPALTPADLAVGAINALFVWPKQQVAVALAESVDEIDLAAALDAYPRTFAVESASTSAGRRPVRSRHGLLLVPARATEQIGAGALVVSPLRAAGDVRPAFDRVLTDVASAFGGPTADLVADQLQYPAAHLALGSAPLGLAGGLVRLVAVLGVGAATGLAVHRARRRRTEARQRAA